MHPNEEKKYLALMERILKFGIEGQNRTGISAKSVRNATLRFNLFNRKLPVVSTRKLSPRLPITEMLWWLRGDTDVKWLNDRKVTIWNKWVREETAVKDSDGNIIAGSIGPQSYGVQWVNWEDTRIVTAKEFDDFYKNYGYEIVIGLDATNIVITRKINQIDTLIETIKTDPTSRRMVVTCWNPAKMMDMVLAPCHHTFTIPTQQMCERMINSMCKFIRTSSKYSTEFSILQPDAQLEFSKDYDAKVSTKDLVDRYKLPVTAISLTLHQRSCDIAVGGAFNACQYGALAHILAKETNTWAMQLVWNITDAHIYSNQEAKVNELLARKPVQNNKPTLLINNGINHYQEYDDKDFNTVGVVQLAPMKIPVAV